MSVTIRKCSVLEIEKASTFLALLAEYGNECAIEGMPDPSAKMDLYRILDKSESFQVLGAFLEEELVGFITILSPILSHYSACASVSESFFVAKKHRKTGAGTKLRLAAEQIVNTIGSAGLLISTPLGGILAEVLPHEGYIETNRVFFKKASQCQS